MATIYLIRHGQASFGAADYDKLSELGERQAKALGTYLARQGIKLDAAYSGDLLRQRKTAELALASQPQKVNHRIDSRFNEIRNEEQIEHLLPQLMERDPALRALVDKGLADSKTYQKVIEAVFNYWVSPACKEPAIQSWEDYSTAARDALQELMSEQAAGKTIAVFSSGGTIATLVAQVLGLGGEHTYKFYEPIFNCSVTQLFYSRDRVSLSYFNDRSFLQIMGNEVGENLVSYR